VVIDMLGAPERRTVMRPRRRPRPKAVEPEPEPAPVPTTRATVVDTDPLTRGEPAAAWLRSVQGGDAGDWLAPLNRLVHAHRIATADPAVHEVALEQALVVRFGYGEGEQVSEGQWVAAVEVPPERRARMRRVAALAPHERLARLFNGSVGELRAEELALRAREDLDGSRPRLVALALEQALLGLPRELGDHRTLAERLTELETLLPGVQESAQAVREGGEPDAETIEHALRRLEALLRARAIGM
jgi:hypothetical protein